MERTEIGPLTRLSTLTVDLEYGLTDEVAILERQEDVGDGPWKAVIYVSRKDLLQVVDAMRKDLSGAVEAIAPKGGDNGTHYHDDGPQ